jgi:hypothetical protein
MVWDAKNRARSGATAISCEGRGYHNSIPTTLTKTNFAALAEILLMRRPFLSLTVVFLDIDSSPLLQPVHDSLHVGILIDSHNAQLLAYAAALLEHDSIVAVVREPLDDNKNLLAAPALLWTRSVAALESSHDVGFLGGNAFFVVLGGVERRFRGDDGSLGRKGVLDVFVEVWKHSSRTFGLLCFLCFRLAGLLLGRHVENRV